MKTHVVIVAEVDRAFVEKVTTDEQFEVETHISNSEEELIDVVRDAHVIVSRALTPLTAAVMRAAPRLELILQGTSGLNNIDVEEAGRRDVRILTTPGANANAVAELVVGLMISMTRSLLHYDDSMKAGDWLRSDCANRRELRNHRIGIVGIGRVGTKVATLLRNFGCDPAAYDPYLDQTEIEERGASRIDSLDELLSTSDILTLHVPLTAETRGMIGPAEIARLPEGAIVINTARGEVADVDALLHALRAETLGGVALDVFEPEPPKRNWPSDPRLILTPHIAGCTAEAKLEAGTRMYRELCGFYGFEPIG